MARRSSAAAQRIPPFLANGGIDDTNGLVKAVMMKHVAHGGKIVELPHRRAPQATRGSQSEIEKKSDDETKRYMTFRRLNQHHLGIKVRQE